ncbi:MAG TPA: MFS transporter, partial [Beijerinckiaceae bacterium]|nr:MFS transporter [Beijerinckiaceae bacterium]
GHVADRFDRRAVLILCYALTALSSLGLAWAALKPAGGALPIFILVSLFGTARAFASPASQAIVPNLVPSASFADAVAISTAGQKTATIIGPALGGLAYAIGPALVFGSTTVLYAGATMALFAMRTILRKQAQEAMSWSYLTAGIVYVRRNPILLGTISLDLFAVLLGGATALLPIYADAILHTGPWGLGLLRSAPALGAFLMSMVLTRFSLRRRVGLRMFQAVIVFGLATIVFGVAKSFWVAAPALFVLGAADMVSVYIRQTLMQIETPDAMRGRVSAVNSLFVGASNELGEFESGLLASLVGAVASVVIGGVGTLAIAGLWMRLFPGLRHRQRLIETHPPVAQG